MEDFRADDTRIRPTGHLMKSDGTTIHGWTVGYENQGRVGSLEGHNLTATLAYHPGSNRLATQTTFPLPLGTELSGEIPEGSKGQGEGAQSALLARSMNIDLLGRTYGVIHTAPDPDAGNTPRIVTALAHSHDIQGRRKSARREDGTIWNYQYNTRSEVSGAEKRQSNSDLVPGLNFGYSYDGLGNRLTASKGTPALVTEYEPDAMNRYATITSPGGDDILVKSDTPVDVEVDEDPVTVTTSGNFRSARITATNTTAPAFPEISITGDNNFSETGHRWIAQAEFSPQYDEDGNLTNDGRWIYTWDAMNRLTGMTPTTAALTAGVPNQSLSFAYDYLGRRIAKKVTTTNGEGSTVKDYRYLYEGWNVVAQFTADTNNILTPDATFLWSIDLSGSFHGAGGVGGLHSVNLLSQSEAAKLCLACYDANGNIIAWTDATGRVLQRQDYDPFGNRVISERLAITPEQSERLEYGFSTKPLDAETRLVYYIYRYYDARHGLWMSRDPIEEEGGLNLYGFVRNAPIAAVDRLGLDLAAVKPLPVVQGGNVTTIPGMLSIHDRPIVTPDGTPNGGYSFFSNPRQIIPAIEPMDVREIDELITRILRIRDSRDCPCFRVQWVRTSLSATHLHYLAGFNLGGKAEVWIHAHGRWNDGKPVVSSLGEEVEVASLHHAAQAVGNTCHVHSCNQKGPGKVHEISPRQGIDGMKAFLREISERQPLECKEPVSVFMLSGAWANPRSLPLEDESSKPTTFGR